MNPIGKTMHEQERERERVVSENRVEKVGLYHPYINVVTIVIFFCDKMVI